MLILFFSIIKQIARRQFREVSLTRTFKLVRSICAIQIQKAWRGYSVRSNLKERVGRVILRWRWGSTNSSSVYIAGDFSLWRKWRMHYFPHLNEYRTTLPLRYIDGRSSFMYKFIVDGLWTCDGSLPMIESKNGIVNNVYQIRKSTQTHINSSKATPSHYQKSQVAGKSEHIHKLKNSQSTLSYTHRLPAPTKVKSAH